jgi:hypothetical protein
MYCPQCATANSADVKFCRSCGTQLEAVALALRTKPALKKAIEKQDERTAQHWLERRIEGVSGLTRGSILLTVSLVLGIPLGLFVPSTFDAPWILIWAVFFGWMAVWGGIEMADGISAILEAKSRLRLLGLSGDESEIEHDMSTGPSLQSPTGPDSIERSSGVSVTEGTTRQLEK